jgi:hypothetical protein
MASEDVPHFSQIGKAKYFGNGTAKYFEQKFPFAESGNYANASVDVESGVSRGADVRRDRLGGAESSRASGNRAVGHL